MKTYGIFGAAAQAMNAARQGQRQGAAERLEREEQERRRQFETEDRFRAKAMGLLEEQLKRAQLANVNARTMEVLGDGDPDVPTTDRARLHARIAALMGEGLSAESANRQARTEFGFAIRPPVSRPSSSSSARPTASPTHPTRTLPVHERRAREMVAAARAARKAVPTERPSLIGPGATDDRAHQERTQAFVADSTRAARHAQGLEAEADRLVQARDSVRAEAIGETPTRRGGSALGAPDTLTAEEAEALYREAAESFQDAIARGADRAAAQAAYNRIVAGIARRAGLLR